MHRADRREEELGVGILQEKPARTLPDRAGCGLVEVERREHDDAGRVGVAQELGCRSEAVEHGHPDVHQHDVGLRGAHDVDRLAAVGRLAHDLDVWLRVDEHADSGAEQRLIVDEHHPDRAHDPPPIGRVPRTTKAPSSRAGVQPPSDELRALPHTDDAVPARALVGATALQLIRLSGRHAGSQGVADLEGDAVGVPREPHVDRSRTTVP